MDDEFWNEFVRGSESYSTANGFGDVMTMTSSFNTSDEIQVVSSPTVRSFDSQWIWNNELEGSSNFTSSNDSSHFHSYTSQSNSPTQETDSSPRAHPSILHKNSPVQETDSTFPSRFECHQCGKKFSTKNNCQRHRRNVHGSNSSSLFIENLPTNIQGVINSASLIPVQQKCDCPHPTCKRKGEMGFSRPDNLIQHRRNVHNENIPKRQRRS